MLAARGSSSPYCCGACAPSTCTTAGEGGPGRTGSAAHGWGWGEGNWGGTQAQAKHRHPERPPSSAPVAPQPPQPCPPVKVSARILEDGSGSVRYLPVGASACSARCLVTDSQACVLGHRLVPLMCAAPYGPPSHPPCPPPQLCSSPASHERVKLDGAVATGGAGQQGAVQALERVHHHAVVAPPARGRGRGQPAGEWGAVGSEWLRGACAGAAQAQAQRATAAPAAPSHTHRPPRPGRAAPVVGPGLCRHLLVRPPVAVSVFDVRLVGDAVQVLGQAGGGG